MDHPIDLRLDFSLPSLPAEDTERLLYGLIEIQGGEASEMIPSDLSFLIDVSDSMHIRQVTEQQFADLVRQGRAQEIVSDGVPAYQISSISSEQVSHLPRRIDFVIDALENASSRLRGSDYFSLIAFAGQAEQLIGRTMGKDRDRLHSATEMLKSLRLGDET